MAAQAVQFMVVREEMELLAVLRLESAQFAGRPRHFVHQHVVAFVKDLGRIAHDVHDVSESPQRVRGPACEAFESAVQMAVDPGEENLHRRAPLPRPASVLSA